MMVCSDWAEAKSGKVNNAVKISVLFIFDYYTSFSI